MSFTTADGLDYILNLVSAREQPVETYYVALCYSLPGITTAGSELDEVEALGYTRGSLLNVSGNWTVSHGQLSNVTDVDYPVAEEEWGEIRYWAVCDTELAGRVLWAGYFTDPVFVAEGDQPQVPAYGLSMYFTMGDSS